MTNKISDLYYPSTTPPYKKLTKTFIVNIIENSVENEQNGIPAKELIHYETPNNKLGPNTIE